MLNSKKNWLFSKNNDMITSPEEMIECFLKAKGLDSKSLRQQFLKPNLEELHAPLLLSGIEKASERVKQAIKKEELIIVYGDYDADGVTSTALMMNILIELGANCNYFVPNRFEHGYGLHRETLKHFSNQQAGLIITVDTGIADVEEVAYANSLGLDVIITDHHEPQTVLPEAHSIIHPMLSQDCPFKAYAGVGVAFQFARHLVGDFPTHLLPLVAIGTVADLVPLVDDNRTLVYHGLKTFKEALPIGIEHLLMQAKKEREEMITTEDIGFIIGPRLNAVGRLADPNMAVELLLTVDSNVAEKIASDIEQLNHERKAIVEKIVEEAIEKVNPNDGIIMLFDEEWHEGVLGIAASRLVQKYDRPVIMMKHLTETNELKGSARSIPSFSLFDHLQKYSHLLTKFGGHSQAAGMTFPFDNLIKVKQALNDEIFTQLNESDFKQEISSIEKVDLNILSEKFVYQFQQLAPFGMGNEEPHFHIEAIPTSVRRIGQDGKHLKIQFKQDKKIVDAIGFHMGHLAPFITDIDELQLVGKLQINEWNGNRTVQMLIEDIKIDKLQVFDYRSNAYYKNFKPFYNTLNNHLMVGLSDAYMQPLHEQHPTVKTIKYGDSLVNLNKVDILYITQLPNRLEELEVIINKYRPQNIHLSYDVIDDAYMSAIPKRDDFKWVYAYIVSKQPIDSKKGLNRLLQIKKWRKEKLLFIIKVFYELQFIYVKDDHIYINDTIEKQSLTASKTYQNHIKQSEIEQKLYYSSNSQIKAWILDVIRNFDNKKEKVSHEI